MLLPNKVRQNHCRAIARKACPGASHVAIHGHEDNVDGDEHGAADAREPSAPDGLVDKFIPKREVEVYAHHDLGRHNNRHHAQAAPVVAPNDVAQHVEVSHHAQEGQQREDDKIFHGLGIGVAVVFVFRFAKHEGLVGIAEGLRDHGHNHGYL